MQNEPFTAFGAAIDWFMGNPGAGGNMDATLMVVLGTATAILEYVRASRRK
jgi:ribulose kinase